MPYFLSPVGNDQQTDANGNPLVGGKIFTYLAGSSTPAATYTDSTSGTQQANPIILNSLGLPASPIWMTGGIALKYVIQDSTGVTQRTVDNVVGINDATSSVSEWIDSNLVPTYISATQFSVPGDQTATLQVNRRLRCRVTAGTAYSRISVSTFSAGITTVTVVNDSTPLDSGLSIIGYGFLSFSPSSVPYALYAAAGANTDITSLAGANALLINSATTSKPPVRQTVLSGPVDTSGLPAFGGSTGSTTVTASGTLIATAANGYALGGGLDYTGSIVNPSWTSLSTNGTMYLYLDIAANGTCTTGSTTLAPVYQWGGTSSTTNNQFTFNIQEMVGRVGNGSSAVQTYRVFVGEVTVAGAVVTAITWYALMGRYDSGYTATLPAVGTYTSRNHNIGTDTVTGLMLARCTTTDAGYSVGQICTPVPNTTNPGINNPVDRLTVGMQAGGSGSGWGLVQRAVGTITNLTAANWSYKLTAQRSW